MEDKLTSRFFLDTDPTITKLVFEIPNTWWSRFYEYAWASLFAEPGDTVMDAGCGICHPFKFFLADRCSEVHACDNDQRILSPEAILQELKYYLSPDAVAGFPQRYFEEIKFLQADITSLPYQSETFDKIFCISVLEHLSPEMIILTLQEFRRVLKKNGYIVLTFDYPVINLDSFSLHVVESGLKFPRPISFQLPSNAINSSLYDLYCYRTILTKLD